jgi:hypothetical protein
MKTLLKPNQNTTGVQRIGVRCFAEPSDPVFNFTYMNKADELINQEYYKLQNL